MRNFDTYINLLWEGLKNPKDNPCWKGYKPVGTKKKNGRTVPNCVPKESKKKLTENYFPVQTSFIHLPATAPYGFWVWGNKYVIANYMDDHSKILREIMPSEYQHLGDGSLLTKAFSLGLIRVVREGETYHIDYTKGSPSALKLVQDIAEFYGKTVSDPFKQVSILPTSSDNAL